MTEDRFAPGGAWERELAEARADGDAGRVYGLKRERSLAETERDVADLLDMPRGDALADVERGYEQYDERQRDTAERQGRTPYHGDAAAETRALADPRVRELDRRASEAHSAGDYEQSARLDAERDKLKAAIIAGEVKPLREQTISDVVADQYGGDAA